MSLHVTTGGHTWTAATEPLRSDRTRREAVLPGAVLPGAVLPEAGLPEAVARITALDRWGDGVGTWRLDLPAGEPVTMWHDRFPLDAFLATDSPIDVADEGGWRGQGYRRAVANERLTLRANRPVTLWLKARPLPPPRCHSLRVDDPAYVPGKVPGLTICELSPHPDARVVLLRFAPGAGFGEHEHEHGEELVVVDGALEDEQGRYPTGSWVRQPPGSRHAVVSPEGCLLYTHSGHLSGP